MSRQGLVPESRTDKNGRSQTKWVRPIQPPAASSTPPPPPPVSPRLRVERLAALDAHWGVAMPWSSTSDAARDAYRRQAERAFAAFSEEMLDEVRDCGVLSNEQLQRGVRTLIERGCPPETIRDFMNLSDDLFECGFEESGYEVVPVMAEVPGLVPCTITGEYPTRRREQLNGLIDATLAVEGAVALNPNLSRELADIGDGTTTFLTNPDLIELAITYPTEIGKVMRERGTLDPEVLRSILEHDVTPLKDGVL